MVQDNAVEHYFSRKPKTEIRERVIKADILGNRLTFYTGASVFSPDNIDNGSRILIENAEIMDGMRILDLGCGYGAVGVSLAKRYRLDLVMTDINERAVMLAVKNARLNGVKATVVQGDGYSSIAGLFDTILLNPPQTAGKKLCFKLIEDAKKYLKQNGTLQLVARHNKGGREFEKHMKEVFGNVRETAIQSGFRIYISKH